MPITTVNMGLTSWSSLTDVFSHTALSANWTALDLHDHSAGKGVQIPQGGIGDGSISRSKVQPLAIDVGRIDDAAVTDAKLERTAAASHYHLVERWIGFGSSQAGATRFLMTPGTANGVMAENANGSIVSAFIINPRDYYLGSYRTGGVYTLGPHVPKFRIQAVAFGNAVAPGGSRAFTVELRTIGAPVGTAGAYPQITSGTTVTGSSTVVTVPNVASQVVSQSSGDFTLSPTVDTPYVLTAQVDNALAANSTVSVRAVLLRTNI